MFPMAGRGERFGTTFKPFLQFGDRTFIEAAVEPFRKWPASISRIVFVFLRQQEQDFNVSARLAQMFAGLRWEAVLLDHPTAGPAETVAAGVEGAGVTGPAIACDCDHAVNVDPLFAAIASDASSECLLPLWDLAGEEVKSWSVAALSADGSVTAIAEKAIPAGASRTAGVIGCYYFRDIDRIAATCRLQKYVVLSEAISDLLRSGRPVRGIGIRQAKFFGDPARLAKAVDAGAP